MNRRRFLGGLGVLCGALASSQARAGVGRLTGKFRHATAGATVLAGETAHETFSLLYAPHFGMFREHGGEDLVGQLEFAAAEGFRAWEDNGMMDRPVEEQERLASAMQRLGLSMGVFVAEADFQRRTFVRPAAEVAEGLAAKMRRAVETAQRVQARWATVVPGLADPGLEPDYQTANVIDNLKRCAEICEPAGLTLVLEPLNPWTDHPGLFLTRIPQAFQICRSVGSPSVKILDDLYHQQITEGNLIPNIDAAWKEIAYFQVGDNPGRDEPTTGEINYANIFAHLKRRGYRGIVGMEHGNSLPGRQGERAVIEAYRRCDP
ncbi:MAG TPA: TIM barrel protein [Acidobacteriota bacterium]|nr:TIM barrel protein [Acidobacteriota bacterium]